MKYSGKSIRPYDGILSKVSKAALGLKVVV